MAKTERLNGLILEELAQAVNREVSIPGALVTISFVECSQDLKSARVAFSVLPDHLAGSALRKLTASSGQIANLINKRIKLRKFPHLVWEFDATEREAEKLEKLIAGIDGQEE